MRKNRIKTLFSNKGESYIPVCILVLFLTALVSVLILYMGLMSQVQIQKRDVKAKLDSTLSEYAAEMFDAIKQGESYEQYIDYDGLTQKAMKTLGFSSDSVTEYAYPNGNCTMTRPTVTVLRGNGFGLTLRYTAIFPIRWNGKTYQSLKVPITVSSYYKFK